MSSGCSGCSACSCMSRDLMFYVYMCVRAASFFSERPPGGRVLSVRGYGARPRTGRHASGLRSGCGGAARGRGG